ncbi:MAG: FlgD immunoglobulin-like domain containing protein [Candidatus Eisenbacteria bacterium]
MRRLLTLFLLLGAVVATPVRAFTPQTITVDGINDFLPGNLLDDDRLDTQSGCSAGVYPMDLGRVYVTNDANFLYVGIEFSKTCYGDMNLGVAFDIGSAGGGTTDPFGRKIGWTSVPFKPDWVVYDVTPTNSNAFNYEILYKDTVGTWVNRSTLINPSWGSGSNGLGIVDSVNFKEFKLPLATLGAPVGTNMHLELWVTQEGTTKGPLDALSSDNVQMSRAVGTTYDTTAVVQMTSMFLYTVLNSVDVAPPTVAQAQAVNFALQANRQFALLTNKVDIKFSEPVDLSTSQTPANYLYSGPAPARTITSAVRDAVAPDLVHLTLSTPISANAGAFAILVSNVRDVANNTIVANGTTNRGSFFIQNVVFNGNFALGLCSGAFAASDTFAVEGNLTPLSFALCDNGLMYDANADSVYTLTVPFALPVSLGTGKGEADLDWKFSHKCNQFEPLGSNRAYHLTSDNGATATINAAWNNDDPSNYTSKAIDVIFKVNAALRNPIPSDVITLLGSSAPLSFTQPGVPMLDNGVAPDQVAGDKIYTARVTFPRCAAKSVAWKVDFNGIIECAGQADRSVYLNDALFSTTTPIVLPARGIDRCEVTDKALTVVFKVNMDRFFPPTAATDSVAVMGDRSPLRFDYPTATQLMFDNGAGFDTQANDAVFTRAITFPDSTPLQVGFKYWKNGTFECVGFGNRTLMLDDVANASATPIVRVVNVWDYCSDPTGVPVVIGGESGTSFAMLRPVMPNPVSRSARFSFDLRRTGKVALSVYDVSGRRVARLLDAELLAGEHSVAWDGKDARGLRLGAGVYIYELAMGPERVARRLIMTR